MMDHVRIATYGINRGTFGEVAALAREGLLETFKEQPGFIRYGVADTGNKSCVSITIWETHEQAEASVPVAATWVRQNLGDKVELRSSHVGDLAFFEGVRATV
jgi:heme-degrading monooxygenase HmoA